MRASEAAGWLSFGALVVAEIAAGEVHGKGVRLALHATALACFIGCFASFRLKGWIGSSYQEMREELARLEKLSEAWRYADGRPIPEKERLKIMRRQQRLIESMQFHPGAPKR